MTSIPAAIIEDDAIINVAEFDSDEFRPSANLIPVSALPAGVWIGWRRDGGGVWFNPGADPVVGPPTAPPVVTRRQARRALALAGLLDQVQLAIDAIPDPIQRQLAQIDWDDATDFRRDDETLLMLAAALGLSEKQLDDLFILAGEQP